MRSSADYLALVRHLGVGWAVFRVRYALRRRLGGLRRASPLRAWSEYPAPALQLNATPANVACLGQDARAEADDILRGRFRLFSSRRIDAGFPPAWSHNQLSDEVVPTNTHWSELGDFEFGDIKGVWELSRFPWAFALVRAHRGSDSTRYADAFWTLFSDWCEKNPPNAGPNWMCGQEATFRLMAALFAAENLPVSDDQRERLARFVVATGRRIAANLDYALSQKNNHGISECVGLISAALAVPDHAESADWLRWGTGALARQLSELVYPDGGFSQHSLVYHRVLLHDLAWAKHRFVGAGREVPRWLDDAGKRATEFLLELVDATSGCAPLYGPNDGANILPLADAEFLDFRPVAQLAAAAFCGTLPFGSGPWDEAVAWLVPGWEKLPRRPLSQAKRWHAPHAGCAQLRNGDAHLFLRCPSRFRHRPAQADMLHVDVWAYGRAIALDGGSYSYNSPERFTTLGSGAQHNALTIDGEEPMRRFSRFLYLPWPTGEAKEDGDGFTASHDGYAGLEVRWRRHVAMIERGFVVEDRIDAKRERTVRWHWRLADFPWRLDEADGSVSWADGDQRYRIVWTGAKSVTARLVRADPVTAYGWWSPLYTTVAPACSLILESSLETGRLRTEFDLG